MNLHVVLMPYVSSHVIKTVVKHPLVKQAGTSGGITAAL